ncbi:anaerobic ribonucleoside-triphosphate reductase activating protein [Ectobacillus panaciterrae]|uniref:anaerobic ribonucleoside-triphosphate reductase activating protein n=1 Tax=Ectobacillus panaciterrae TaxID=363872 RepID=UPI0004022131|nr:anaerobic ribonucleoside-triphosphate reductase activating protein [Ectobacillus panaciterrae]
MRILNILHDSVVDGEGLRTVVFFAGCPHRCFGCHNPQSWDWSNGIQMSAEEALQEIISNSLTNVTFSGGEPFMQAREAKKLARMVKESGKTLWMYTGYTFEEIQRIGNRDMIELLDYADVLVDGRFEWNKKDRALPFRGSGNQRIIRLDKRKGEII